jgi:hypothetical protein
MPYYDSLTGLEARAIFGRFRVIGPVGWYLSFHRRRQKKDEDCWGLLRWMAQLLVLGHLGMQKVRTTLTAIQPVQTYCEG